MEYGKKYKVGTMAYEERNKNTKIRKRFQLKKVKLKKKLLNDKNIY